MAICPVCKKEYKGFGNLCRSCSKSGEKNPAKKIEVRDRISASVKKQYEIHKEKNLPYGFCTGENNPGAKRKGIISESNHEKVYDECYEQYGSKCFICYNSQNKKPVAWDLIIHHLNHCHEDDRIENMIPVCRSCHQKLHRWWKGWTLSIQTDIDYGHHLPNHQGKCFFSHGHTAIIKLKVKGLVKEDGMVLDFKQLKEMLKNCVEPLDHSYLNNFEENPSSELLTSFIYNQIEIELMKIRIKDRRIVWIDELEVSEGLGKSIIINNK